MSYHDLPQHRRELAERILTRKQLRVFRLRFDGHTWRHIAAALELNEATCRGHYERALARIDAELRKDTAA